MTNKKNLMTLLGIAFVVAIIATGLFYGLVVSKLNNSAAAGQDTVVVAARELQPGHVLAPDDMALMPRSSVDILVEGFRSAPPLAGFVVMTSIPKGAALDRKALASRGSAAGAALGIPPGQRAISVHVADSTGVVRLLRPGHRVDAQIVSNSGRRNAKTVRTILQNIEVLRVEDEPEASEGRPILPVVTVLVTPEEADALAMADAAARIRFLLRHPLDDELTERTDVGPGILNNPPKQARRMKRLPAAAAEGEETPTSVETAARRTPAAER